MLKKGVALLLALTMALGLAACGNSKSGTNAPADPQPAQEANAGEDALAAEQPAADGAVIYQGDQEPVKVGFIGWGYTDGLGMGYQRALDYAAPICGFEVEYATYSIYDEIITSAENLIQAGCKVVMTTKASTSLMDLCEQNEVYMAQWGSPIDDPELAEYLAKSPYWVGCSTVDDYDAGYQCVENLYENGCRNIALIGTGAGNYCHDLRFTGMYDAAKTHDDLKILGEFRSASLQSEGAAAVQNFCALYPELDGIVASGASNGILELVIQTLDTEGRSDVKFATLDIQPGTDEYLEEGSLSFIGGGQYLEVMFLAIDAVNIVDGAYEGNTQLDTKFIYITGADDYDLYVQYIDNEGVYPYSPEELQSVTYRCNPEMKFEDLYGMWNSYTLDSIVAKNQ